MLNIFEKPAENPRGKELFTVGELEAMFFPLPADSSLIDNSDRATLLEYAKNALHATREAGSKAGGSKQFAMLVFFLSLMPQGSLEGLSSDDHERLSENCQQYLATYSRIKAMLESEDPMATLIHNMKQGKLDHETAKDMEMYGKRALKMISSLT